MRLLLNKEIKLATHVLTWAFLAFGLMALLPGYPIALGAFFMCLGLFQSFQKAREDQDVLYSALLPIAKRDVVTAKFVVVAFVQLVGLAVVAALACVRMGPLAEAPVYVQNALLPANLTFLGCTLLVFAAFNLVFVRGFFKTAYYYGKPFLAFTAVAMLLVGAFEVAWHLPGLGALGTIAPNGAQAAVLAGCAAAWVATTWAALRASQRSFERIDLS